MYSIGSVEPNWRTLTNIEIDIEKWGAIIANS